MRKTCSLCKEEKELSSFNKRSSSKDKHQARCRVCENAVSKNHYLSNKDYYGLKRDKNRNKYRDVNRNLKETAPCSDCGKYYPYFVMDWDHREGEDKISEVSRLLQQGTINKMLLEVKKCDLVCSNCHRMRTFNRLELLGERSSKG